MMIHKFYKQFTAAFLISWTLHPLMQRWYGHHDAKIAKQFHTKQEENGLGSGIFKRWADVLWNGYQYGTSTNVRPNDPLEMSLAEGFSQMYDPTRENQNLPGDFLYLFSKLQGPFQPNLHCQGNNYYPTPFGNVCVRTR